MIKFFKTVQKINKLLFKIFWFPVDYPVMVWLKSYTAVSLRIPVTFYDLNKFSIAHIPSLKFFYAATKNLYFFEWWFNKHIFARLLYLYIFFCFICALCYSVFEIHLISLFEIIAVFELTWLQEIFQQNGIDLTEVGINKETTMSFFQSKEEWTFLMHIMWGGLFLFIYFLQLLLFTQLIFSFFIVIIYFLILFMSLTYFMSFDVNLLNIYDPTHIAFLQIWHVCGSLSIIFLSILCFRVFYIRFRFYNPSFNSNFFMYLWFLFKKVLIYYSYKFWTAKFVKKLWLILYWSFLINFGLLLFFIMIKLLIYPEATGDLLWLLILRLFTAVKTWHDLFNYPWTILFQVFISIAINILYDLVFFTIAIGAFYFIICFFWINFIGFFLLIIYFPGNWKLYKNYIFNMCNIVKFIQLLKKWIPTLRAYCYAAVSFNFTNFTFSVQGVRERRSQRPFWKIYNQNKQKRRQNMFFIFFFDYFVNNIKNIAGYKNTYKNNVNSHRSVWKTSYVYGTFLKAIQRTKGLKGRWNFINKHYIHLFNKRFCFFLYKWKKNPGILGHLIVNSKEFSIFSKIKGYFFIFNHCLTSFFFKGKFQLFFSKLIFILSFYFLCLKWFFYLLIIYTFFFLALKTCYKFRIFTISQIHFISKLKKNQFFFFSNFFIMGCLLGILTIFCSMLEALFKKFPDLAESFFKNIPGFLNFYEQMQGLLFEDKLNWNNLNINLKLWALLYFHLLFILFLMIVSIFALVEYIGCFIKYICQSMSNIISKTLLILSFSPFLLLIDLGLHVLFFFMKLFIYIGVCLHILFINLLKILNYEVDSSWQGYLINTEEYKNSYKLTNKDLIFFVILLLFFSISITFVYFFFLCG